MDITLCLHLFIMFVVQDGDAKVCLCCVTTGINDRQYKHKNKFEISDLKHEQ